jgi:hypothetical protein
MDPYSRRWTPYPLYAIDAEIPKLDVAGSNPVSRSIGFNQLADLAQPQRGKSSRFVPLNGGYRRVDGVDAFVFNGLNPVNASLLR